MRYSSNSGVGGTTLRRSVGRLPVVTTERSKTELPLSTDISFGHPMRYKRDIPEPRCRIVVDCSNT